MKILMTLFTRRNEGTFYRAMPWARLLVSRGHDATLLCTSKTRRFRSTVSMDHGVRIIETPALFSGRHIMTRLCGLYGWGELDILARLQEIRRGHYDIIHTFEHQPSVALPVFLAGRKNVPVLVADWCDHYGKGGFREYEYSPYRLHLLYQLLGGPFRLWVDHLERSLRRRADAVTVISTFLKERALHLGVDENRIHLIPGSADTANIRPKPKADARAACNLPADPPCALFFGAGQFDVDFSLEAFALVLKKLPAALFIIVGKEDPAVRRKAAALNISENIIQTGWVDDDGLNDWLACADVCLLPMKDNPPNHARWPNKIGFYMAAGRPVVATGVNDAGTLIRHKDIGEVCPVDTHQFADRILSLFENPQRAAEMGRRARETADAEFATAIQGSQLEQLYTTLSAEAS